MTIQPELGRIDWIGDVRQVWNNEARDFTPWLLANADLLGEALGISLALESAEHPPVGISSISSGVTSITRPA